MSTIHPKVLAAFIAGHIGTIAAVVAALFKVIPGDPKLYALFGEALTFCHFGAGYFTSGPARTVLTDAGVVLNAVEATKPKPPAA